MHRYRKYEKDLFSIFDLLNEKFGSLLITNELATLSRSDLLDYQLEKSGEYDLFILSRKLIAIADVMQASLCPHNLPPSVLHDIKELETISLGHLVLQLNTRHMHLITPWRLYTHKMCDACKKENGNTKESFIEENLYLIDNALFDVEIVNQTVVITPKKHKATKFYISRPKETTSIIWDRLWAVAQTKNESVYPQTCISKGLSH